MRIIIDLQGAQTGSRFRGIGRYAISLTKSIIKNKQDHEIIVVLNGLLNEFIESIRSELNEILPQKNILVFYAPEHVSEIKTTNFRKKIIGEKIREAFLASLKPDFILVTSLFEGFDCDALTSIATYIPELPTAVILYDLFPLKDKIHTLPTLEHINWYDQKIKSLHNADLLLSISDFSSSEAKKLLNINDDRVKTIGAGYDPFFRASISQEEKNYILKKLDIEKKYILCVGGGDDRKNIPRLIQSFSLLPPSIRNEYQLVHAGKIPHSIETNWKLEAKTAKLSSKNFKTLGYIDDHQLAVLYQSCTLFVFPSLEEGFGFPPLEAMSCGAAVISSNRTSLPEVIGLEDALFDPFKVESIRDKIYQVLTNDSFKEKLIQHGLVQSKKFSWENSAKLAMSALSEYRNKQWNEHKGQSFYSENFSQNSLSIMRSGIFKKNNKKILLIKLDHRGDFILAIPAIMKLRARYPYAEIDILIGKWNIDIAHSLKIFTNIIEYDFFKEKSALPSNPKDDEQFFGKLKHYDIAIDLRRQRDTRFLLSKIKANLKVGYQTHYLDIDRILDISLPSELDIPFTGISHNYESISIQMIKLIDILPSDVNDYIFLPELITPKNKLDKNFYIAIFPYSGNNIRNWKEEYFLELISLLVSNEKIGGINLYFSNEKESEPFLSLINEKVRIYAGLNISDLFDSLINNQICIANNSFGAHIASYLGIDTIVIFGGSELPQEWGPVFNKPLIIYKSMNCSPCHLADKTYCDQKMECLFDINPLFIYQNINYLIENKDIPHLNTFKVFSEKQKKDGNSSFLIDALIKSIIEDCKKNKINDYLFFLDIAKSISINFPPPSRKNHLFIDTSELAYCDSFTGIQRVVKNILNEFFSLKLDSHTVTQVYINNDNYYEIDRFIKKDQSTKFINPNDKIIDLYPGDILFIPDLSPRIINMRKRLIQYRDIGVNIWFYLYDLLPYLHPEWFSLGTNEWFSEWLSIISMHDGIICSSIDTANQFINWYQSKEIKRSRPLKLGIQLLASDFMNASQSRGILNDADLILKDLTKRLNFLMVGTLEPRKGHAQTILAFEKLWKDGLEANLIMVGKEGWENEKLVNYITNHSYYNKRLFWLKQISDEFLDKIYSISDCLIVASLGEGFGLPIIEGAQKNIPIICRSLSVFKEIAGEGAFYFSGNEAEDLANAIKSWVQLKEKNNHPKSDLIPHITWNESVQKIKEILFEDKWTYIINPDGTILRS